MKKLFSIVLAAVMALSFVFVSFSKSVAANAPGSNAVQVVPQTKKISRRVYRRGRYITITTWKHGKRIAKRVWVKGNYYGRKTVRKTKHFVVGKPRRTP
jgi:hypothetical protein